MTVTLAGTPYTAALLIAGYMALTAGLALLVWVLRRASRFRRQRVVAALTGGGGAATTPRAGRVYPRSGRPAAVSRLDGALVHAPRRVGWPPLVRAAATPLRPARATSHTAPPAGAWREHGRDSQTVLLTRVPDQQTQTWTRPAGLATRR
jgi:hypothetical protein